MYLRLLDKESISSKWVGQTKEGNGTGGCTTGVSDCDVAPSGFGVKNECCA